MAESADFSGSVIKASDEVKEICCDLCNKDGNLVSAEVFCVDCSEYLCKQCFNSHRRFKALANHVLQDMDSMPDPAKSTRGVIDVCVEKCSNHPSKVVDFFCGTCDILGCYACITVNHRQWENVVHIPDNVKEPETSVEFNKFDRMLENIAKLLNEQKEKIAHNTETNVQMKTLAKDELKKQRHEINNFFDDLERKMDLEIENIQKDNTAALKAASDRLESMEEELKEIKTSIDSKKNGQNCELFIAMKKNKQKIVTLNERFNKYSDESRIQKYTLLPSEQIEAMMRNITEICRMTAARFHAKIDISTSNDKEIKKYFYIPCNGSKVFVPRICGLTIAHGHYCVVTDHDNKSIKVVDTISKCAASEIAIENKHIFGLTTVKNDCVAVSVSLPDEKGQIQFFSVSSSGVITSTAKQFDVEHTCWDLEYYNDKLFLSQGNRIRICNMNGQEIKKIIKHDSDRFGIFCMPDNMYLGISLSPEGKTIYVTDAKKQLVTSMTLDGDVKDVYEDQDLKNPWGITVDKDGYVYVRSTSTRSIHQLTADLKRVQTIIEDVDGAAITFSSTENKLYFSEGKCISVCDLLNH